MHIELLQLLIKSFLTVWIKNQIFAKNLLSPFHRYTQKNFIFESKIWASELAIFSSDFHHTIFIIDSKIKIVDSLKFLKFWFQQKSLWFKILHFWFQRWTFLNQKYLLLINLSMVFNLTMGIFDSKTAIIEINNVDLWIKNILAELKISIF